MFVLITFILLFSSIVAMFALRLARPGASYAWVVTGGTLLAWLSVLLWQFDLPWQFMPAEWMSAALFNASPQFLANPFSWLYALSITGLAVAVILTSPVRGSPTWTDSWFEILALTALGLVVALADNPLAMVLAWTAIDLTEFLVALRERSVPGESAWFSFSMRLLAIGCALWASMLGVSVTGLAFSFETAPPQAAIFLLVAAGLRLGALPLRLAYQPDEPSARRGFGTVLAMVSALTGLLVLARLPSTALDLRWSLPFLVLAVVAALYGGWKWLFARDELKGRPYWLAGMSALSLAACVGGNTAGSVAWGVTLILFGGISFLYSVKQVWITRVFAALGLLILALPFTLTASGWQVDLPFPFVFWPLFILSHAMLAAGYVRHLLHPAEFELAQLPNWAQAAYPVGMGILVLTALLGGLWGWPGALNLGAWPLGLAALLLSALIVVAFLRLPQLPFLESLAASENQPLRFTIFLKLFSRLFSFIYQLIGGLVIYISDLLEGDGGLLWTILLLILLISFLRGR